MSGDFVTVQSGKKQYNEAMKTNAEKERVFVEVRLFVWQLLARLLGLAQPVPVRVRRR